MQIFAEIRQIKHAILEALKLRPKHAEDNKNSEIFEKLRIPSGGQRSKKVTRFLLNSTACNEYSSPKDLDSISSPTKGTDCAKMKQKKRPLVRMPC